MTALEDFRTWVGSLDRRVLWGVASAVVVLAVAYGGVATFMAGRVASNVTVGGVAVGGMSPGEASAALQRELTGTVSTPVHLRAPSGVVDLQPAEAGLQVDVPATVAGLTGFTMNPLHLLSHLTGAKDEPYVVRVDRGKLTAAVTKAARALDKPAREGSIAFTDGKVVSVLSVAGVKVRVAETADAVAVAWPHRSVVQAVATMDQPRVSAAEISRAARDFAVPAMMAPVTVLAGAEAVSLRPGLYAPALSTRVDGAGRLQLTVDTPRLMALIRTAVPGLERASVDATVRLTGGLPVVVADVAGSKLDAPAVAAGFRVALTSSTRTVTIALVPATAKVTAATAQGWRITEPISTFTTQFPVNPPRTNNIKIAIAKLNGTLIRPGGQFSLNATLGQRTPAKGYQKAPVISGGRLVSDYGGGVSQVSTTTFNAAFFAGVKINQIQAHSFYIARYPEGREATVSWPDVDQRWTNDTGAGVLVQAGVSGSNITVTLWGTKTRDIEAVKGPRRNVVQPKTIVDAKPGCVAQAPTPGFDVTVTQIFRQNGAQVKTVLFNTHYIPEDSVTCTSPPAP